MARKIAAAIVKRPQRGPTAMALTTVCGPTTKAARSISTPGGLTFALKVQDDRLKPVKNDPDKTEHLEVGFELTDLRTLASNRSWLAQPSVSANGNWVTYRNCQPRLASGLRSGRGQCGAIYRP